MLQSFHYFTYFHNFTINYEDNRLYSSIVINIYGFIIKPWLNLVKKLKENIMVSRLAGNMIKTVLDSFNNDDLRNFIKQCFVESDKTENEQILTFLANIVLQINTEKLTRLQILTEENEHIFRNHILSLENENQEPSLPPAILPIDDQSYELLLVRSVSSSPLDDIDIVDQVNESNVPAKSTNADTDIVANTQDVITDKELRVQHIIDKFQFDKTTSV